MSERRFTHGLKKPGNAAKVRESVSQAIRDSYIPSRIKSVDPIDYETYVVQNKVQLHNDAQRDMVNFPHDDVVVPPPAPMRRSRTAKPTVPMGAGNEASSLLVRECISSYTSACHMIDFKYKEYSGNFQQLPANKTREVLPEQVFEIDADAEEKEEDPSRGPVVETVTKKGWLFKGPEGNKDTIFTRQFKRRFFCLKQQSDQSYILEFYKDDKKNEAKGAIYLDLAQDVVKNTKRGKFCFEVRIHDRASYLFAAENEAEADDWIMTLRRVINASETASLTSIERAKDEYASAGKVDYTKLENSVHPELQKYFRLETESALARARQEGRHNLFSIYPDINKRALQLDMDDNKIEDEVEIFPKEFRERFLLQVREFRLRLQANIAEDGRGELLCNPEPFFLTFALYDAKAGRKISEDFQVDPNLPDISTMIPAEVLHASDRLHSVEGRNTTPNLNGIPEEWIRNKNRAGLCSVSGRHPDIYLFARIEKVLQGGISSCAEPYIKVADVKSGTKVHRQMKQFCSHIGHYRMPFAWAARPVFSNQYSNPSSLVIYKQEGSKMTEEEIIKHLNDMRKPEKQSKWQVIPGLLKISIHPVTRDTPLGNTLTSSLVPVKPFPNTLSPEPVIEVEEFPSDNGKLCSPHGDYMNSLYVYPLQLKYDSQKSFPKARNISCCVELRDSDEDKCVPLKRIYGRPGMSVFTTVASTSILHHNAVPDFSEEVKISLPTQLHEKHHLLFRFYHVSCQSSKSYGRNATVSKKRDNIESCVGYAWLPILSAGRVNVDDQVLSVSVHLPPNYLNYEPFGPGRGSAGPDVKFVDGGRPVFRVNLRLVSTVYTKDQHLHNFFQLCERMENSVKPSVDTESINKLKSLHALDHSTIVQFLPTILNQLFRLMPKTVSDDVAINAVRVVVHVVSVIHDVFKTDALDTYVKYVFRSEVIRKGSKQKTVHEELAKHLTSILRPANADMFVIMRLLSHSRFFFEVLLKSMTQYLIDTERVKMPRNERFSADFQVRIQNLHQAFVPHILHNHKEYPSQTRNANHSIATFIKRCFTLMDRGFVFRLISTYMENFNIGDVRTIQEYKFEFLRIICNHEHYIPLCLPLMKKGLIKHFKDIKQEDLVCDYTLSDEYRKKHYLTGLLLQELELSLQERPEIRKCAITVLRDLIAKHSFDDRYITKSQQGRIAALYLPLLSILLCNKEHLVKCTESTTAPPSAAIMQNGDSGLFTDGSMQRGLMPSLEQNKRDSMFAQIAGQSPAPRSMLNLMNSELKTMDGSTSSLASSEASSEKDNADKLGDKSHARNLSVGGALPSANPMMKYRKLDSSEVKDLFVCFIHVLKYLPEDILLGWFNNSSEYDIVDLFSLLEVCLYQFRYLGRRKIVTLSIISDSRKARTLPVRRSTAGTGTGTSLTPTPRTNSQYGDMPQEAFHMPTSSEADALICALQEGNMSTEVGMVVLDILALYSQTFKQDLEHKDGDNSLMRKTFDLYLSFLQSSQSETLQKHVFAAWRSFFNKFPKVLFKGNAFLCGDLCYEILRCCNSKLNSTRKEACALLYLLMRANFEFSKKTSFTRVHLQVIISVSQLIGDVVGLSTSRFQESLVMVNNYATSDRAMKGTKFPGEVKDLTKRIRTVLMATAQMKEHQHDPEMLADLQYSLAKSYASTPELRKTWLDSMAKIHNRNGDHSEAAHCYIHIAALVAEYLKRRGGYPQGCAAFSNVSPNIQVEESGIRDDSGMQDVQYSEDTLVELLEQAARGLEKAERYETLGEVYKLIIPIYEKTRNFERLAQSYQSLMQAYNKVLELQLTNKRLLGSYFRVAFYGQAHFEEEGGKEYIYKEPKVTSLAEICDRLGTLYGEKFGKDSIKLIKDSNKVVANDLDPKYAYIQVTFVTPYFDDHDREDRVTVFERNNNIKRFMYETPFTKDGKSQGSASEQWKRRTILTTTHSFPYVKKRIEVSSHKVVSLSPIEVSIDEMQGRVSEIRSIVNAPITDLIKLQLKLQGCLNPQVNAGPMAYAEAFLSCSNVSKFSQGHISSLKEVFRQFLSACCDGLELNSSLISTEQKEYHEAMKSGYVEMRAKLEDLLAEKASTPNGSVNSQNSYGVFSVISGLNGSSTA